MTPQLPLAAITAQFPAKTKTVLQLVFHSNFSDPQNRFHPKYRARYLMNATNPRLLSHSFL
jgi:hypothetical protein